MRGGLLQLSGMVVDIVQRVDHLPAAGEEVETSEFRMTAGGGFNAMAAARRMGIPVTYGGILGQGPLAEIVADAMRAEGIAIAVERRAAMEQGSCIVIVDGTGERSFITYHGAEREVDVAHLVSLSASFHDYALLTGYSLYKPKSAAAFLQWFEILHRPPLLFFDPCPVVGEIPRATLDKVMQRADWVSANAEEARVMTGERDGATAAAALSAGRTGALVRLGRDGCWLAHAGSVRHVTGFAVETIDTNGAGDTHDGGFIAALILGYGAGDAAVIANAAAALSTTKLGPATAPDFGETLRFLSARRVDIATPGDGLNRAPMLPTTEEDSA